ncbi:MAG: type I-F CRISPR-associated endoribonuclease Cas6/Csy4, partial [Pseudomonadales bacterium]|nr:type I-F CRISPR-associated endoribonuclease Cas6/Csy4 [Pseudomonadales bacterium]
MKYYIDITLLPDPETSLGFLWQKVYQQVHLALVENKIGEQESAVAISIPEYGANGYPLGSKLRLLAQTKALLAQLNITEWLSRFTDYAHVTSIKNVPDNVDHHVCFVRKQVKGTLRQEASLIKKAKYITDKFGGSFDACLDELTAKSSITPNKMPFVWVQSLSSQKRIEGGLPHRFPLFIEKVEDGANRAGTFNCYGLSV